VTAEYQLPRLTLVIGGARSGKTALAERLVRGTGRPRTVIVTAEIWDDEMRARIEAHRAARGAGWQVIEAPQDLPARIAGVEPGGAVLVDCITLWLTNRMLAKADLAAETEALTEALARVPGPVVVVTNEVGLSIVPENALARRFRDEQGRINQCLAPQADLVLGVMAGLPFVLKGALPDGFAP
jgi:adenosylcobinamide kinase / adenosylcobinamide-phosphate guanylyltransferase